MKLRHVLFSSVFGLTALAAAPLVHSQPYPNKPVTIIVPYPPGGTSDILARSLGQTTLSARLRCDVLAPYHAGQRRLRL